MAKQYSGNIYSRRWTELENAWHHVACVHDSNKGETRIYLDGTLTVPQTSQIQTVTLTGTSQSFPLAATTSPRYFRAR